MPLKVVRKRLEAVLDNSVAEETEIVWFERRRGWASVRDRSRRGLMEQPLRTVLLRVVEGRRLGWHRTEVSEIHELEDALRQALALAKVQPKLSARTLLPEAEPLPNIEQRLFDRRIANLDLSTAHELLAPLCEDGERARLSWSENRLLVLNSRGVARSATATEATLFFQAGQGPGAGYAAASARALEGIDPRAVRQRARHRRGELGTTEQAAVESAPEGTMPVLLSAEAVVELLNALNTFALSGRYYLSGASFLSRHRGVQVFDRRLHLVDDGTCSTGLPFPYDLEGSPKRALELIVSGKPTTPALDQHQGAQAGLEPTAQAVGGGDALCGNLFLRPGEDDEEALLAAADGGLAIGRLETPECLDPSHLHLRMVARGVRRIEHGRLGQVLPDLVWEDSLLRQLALIRAVGRETTTMTTPSTPLGGICAPALVIGDCQGFHWRAER